MLECSSKVRMDDLARLKGTVLRGTTSVLRGYYKRTAWVIQAYCVGTPSVLRGYSKRTAWVLQAYCAGTTSVLTPVCTVRAILHGYYKRTAWVLHVRRATASHCNEGTRQAQARAKPNLPL
jgi:hypothetical protein